MGRVVTIHSYKGGTGKTILLTNLAAIYAMKGQNVCLLDLDLRAPSLGITFQSDEAKQTINDYLEKRCEIDDVIFASNHDATKGRFLVGLADHSPIAIQAILAKDRKWEMNALHRITTLKNTLIKDMGIDYVFLDTSPGLHYSSLNAISIADMVLSVTVVDESDVDGTKRMIQDIYELLDRRVNIILNKVPPQFIETEAEQRGFIKSVYSTLAKPVLSLIPCYCDVLRSKRSTIFAYEYPHGLFTQQLIDLSERISKEL